MRTIRVHNIHRTCIQQSCEPMNKPKRPRYVSNSPSTTLMSWTVSSTQRCYTGKNNSIYQFPYSPDLFPDIDQYLVVSPQRLCPTSSQPFLDPSHPLSSRSRSLTPSIFVHVVRCCNLLSDQLCSQEIETCKHGPQ